ncbi:hypothetical protein DCCM_2445 [Desulfocucumis palustris]|uniref:Uncharacterized protein n=1 Tax=Desulfocucumis palustris TaxID=1898651 RepID=A0A2L2XGK5_9FIRM|nr:hypothetical protein DCCM_2445 [Desulfocucumis palustris]
MAIPVKECSPNNVTRIYGPMKHIVPYFYKYRINIKGLLY